MALADGGGVLRIRWRVAPEGYEITDTSPPLFPAAGAYVIAKGVPLSAPIVGVVSDDFEHEWLSAYSEFQKRHKTYEARPRERDIFIKLATTPCTPEGVLAFANEWGLLAQWPGMPLEAFIYAIESMKEAIEDGLSGPDTAVARRLSERLSTFALRRMYMVGSGPSDKALPSELGAGDLHTHFEWEDRGDPRYNKPQLFFEAHTLWQFCLLEHLQTLSGGFNIRTCENCGRYVRLRKPKSGGRAPTYCDNACRQAAYRSRTKKEARALECASLVAPARGNRVLRSRH